MSRSAIDNSKSGRWFHREPWEALAMTLIAGGIVMMVQPWSIDLYSYSFVVVLAGTLGFVVVSNFPE
jgi:ABC-type xylose transport system permease subunit